MKVYAELVFLDNMFIDYILLASSARLYPSCNLKKARLAFAAAAGGAFAAVFPLIPEGILTSFIIKLFVCILLICIAFGIDTPKQIMLRACVYMALNLLAGGIIIGMGYLLGYKNSLLSGGIVTQIPLFAVIIGTCAVAKLSSHAVTWIKKRIASVQHCILLRLSLFGIVSSIDGYVDSGNMMIDPVSGLPVVVISMLNLNDEIKAKMNENDLPKLRYNTASGIGEMYIIRPDWVKAGKEEKNISVMIGATDAAIMDGKALIPIIAL